MDYFPMFIYTPKRKFWPVIDDALKTAAIEHQIQVKLLISYWNHSAPSEDNFLKSLSSLTNAYKKVSIEVVSIFYCAMVCIINYFFVAETFHSSVKSNATENTLRESEP